MDLKHYFKLRRKTKMKLSQLMVGANLDGVYIELQKKLKRNLKKIKVNLKMSFDSVSS